ncbi:MAG: sterol desaturase family protein [Deltaproteobacteria bacterium]|nr:sterol desaturase family protein [Deltaproteobacteria bacterium]
MDLAAVQALAASISPWLYGFGAAAIILETVFLVVTKTERDVASRRLGISCGLLGFGTEALVKVGVGLAALLWVYEHRVMDLGFGWHAWLVAFLANDLMFYVSHRASHEVRLLWAVHVVHHSAKHYDLTTGVRGSALGVLTTLPFYAWIPLVGVHPVVMLLVHQIFNFYGLAYHTEYVRRMGPLEAVIVTPSSHRVHHATNPQYIDRNYGGFFILFDRLFGTFVPEEEPCVYGLKKDWHSYSLWDAQVHEFRDIWRDVRGATSVREAVGYVLGPPGWRPG